MPHTGVCGLTLGLYECWLFIMSQHTCLLMKYFCILSSSGLGLLSGLLAYAGRLALTKGEVRQPPPLLCISLVWYLSTGEG